MIRQKLTYFWATIRIKRLSNPTIVKIIISRDVILAKEKDVKWILNADKFIPIDLINIDMKM